MSAPPTDLMQWPKAKLAAEVKRLRAVLREHAEQPAGVPRNYGAIVDSEPEHGYGDAILDTGAILMDEVEVCLVDRKTDEDPLAMFLLLSGRVNMEDGRARQGYLFGPDGASGLCVQVIELAARAGGEFADEFKALFDKRLRELRR